MNSTDNNMLVVSASAKRIGMSVFAQSELTYFAVKTLKLPGTNRHIKRQISEMIQAMICEFAPKTIVVKSPAGQQINSKKMEAAIAQIKKEAETAATPLQEISLEMVKEKICRGVKPTKTHAFEILSAVYPELRRFVNHPSRWQKEYYDSLLSAALIGFYHQSEANRNLE